MTNKRRAGLWLALTAAAALVVFTGPVGAQGSLAELLRNIVQNAVTLTANRIVLGNGSSSVTVLGSLGTSTTVLHGNAGGAPSFGAVSLTADVSGVLPIANMATGTPNGSKFVRDDGVLATPAGGGDVSGPGIAVTDGHLAVWDGTSGTAIKDGGAPSGGGPVEQHTASSSASLDFTTCISSTYDEYIFEFVNVIPATDSVSLWMRMSTDGGSSYASSSYRFRYWAFAAGSATAGSDSASQIELTRSELDSTSSLYGLTGWLRLFSPLSTSLRKMVMGEFFFLQDGAGTPPFELSKSGGSYDSATAVNAVQFLTESGNIASGAIRCYGIAK